MPYINIITNEYELDRPHRVRLESGLTATGPEVTDEMLTNAGWQWKDHPIPPASIDSDTITTSTNTTS